MSRAQHHQRVVDALQAVRRLPSLSAGVLRAGELDWTGHAGDGGGSDVQYRIGSITKTMTAVLVMQAREQGALSLDDELGRWLAESSYASLTLRDLLAHCSGLPSEPVGDWWERSEGVDIATLVARNREVMEPPGTFHYSNLGFGLLGEVVSRIAEQPWGALVSQRIWEPLGMERTSLLPQSPAMQGLSVHHLRGTLTREPATDTASMAPAGQVWSTITDLARYARFLAAGHDDVLPRDVLVEMRRPWGDGVDYGLGVMTNLGMVGHLGTMPGFQASLFIDPDSGDGVIGLCNATTGYVGVDFTARMLGEQTPPPGEPWVPTNSVPDWAEELLGYWHWGNSAYEVRWHNERLEFFDLARGGLAEQFVETEDGEIVGHAGYHRGERLQVVRDADGRINHLVCATFVYTREPYDPRAPIPGGVPD